MIVSIPFGPYNKAQLGRPWGSKVVSWPAGSSAVTEFHEYLPNTDGAPHLGGNVRLSVIPGDIVRWGQKVKTVGPGVAPAEYPWGIVEPVGTVRTVTHGEALEHYRQVNGGQPPPGPRRGGRNSRQPFPERTAAPTPAPARAAAPAAAPAPPPAPTAAASPPPAPVAAAPELQASLLQAAVEQRKLLEAALRSIIDPVETALVTAEGFRERARRIARNALEVLAPP